MESKTQTKPLNPSISFQSTLMKTTVAILCVLYVSLSGIREASATIKIGTTTVNDTNEHYLSYVRYITVPFDKQTGADWDAGNDTTGKTAAEVQTIVDAIKALETDPVQQEIYTAMNASATETFAFRDINHAKANVLQR